MTQLWEKIQKVITMYDDVFVVLALLLSISIVFGLLKNQLKKHYFTKYGNALTKENNEEIVQYYEKRYTLDLIHAVITGMIVIGYLYMLNVSFAFLSVAIGAFILILQPYIQSLLGYILLTMRFNIGDTIKIGEYTGDIIFLKPMFTGIAGRNDMGEHIGEVHVLPNNKFTGEVVTRLEIKSSDIRKNIISFVYTYELFGCEYAALLANLREFLHEVLPVRTIEECGFYKSYIGHKFKLSSKYEGKDLIITIGYLDTYADARDSVEQIIGYIEGLKLHS